ncbi:hypothetical protein CPB86DRAFT_795454 [Serendipita vermifera]|nr:hypothetical protein CPB86DRAFT_795454 [Serendipita vermifera]
MAIAGGHDRELIPNLHPANITKTPPNAPAHNEDRLARNLSPVRYIKLNGVNIQGLPIYFRCQSGTTYGDISELLRTHRKSKSLEALAETLGPTKLPYWEIPEKTLLIPEGTRELWILDPQEACFLSLIRTKGDKDAPILIGKVHQVAKPSGRSVMILPLDKSVLSDIFELERYLQQLPEGGHSITFHGETKDLRD